MHKHIDFLNNELNIVLKTIYEDEYVQTKKDIKAVILCVCAVLLFPFCLERDFHKIKVSHA